MSFRTSHPPHPILDVGDGSLHLPKGRCDGARVIRWGHSPKHNYTPTHENNTKMKNNAQHRTGKCLDHQDSASRQAPGARYCQTINWLSTEKSRQAPCTNIQKRLALHKYPGKGLAQHGCPGKHLAQHRYSGKHLAWGGGALPLYIKYLLH